jgi:hypothetical protein
LAHEKTVAMLGATLRTCGVQRLMEAGRWRPEEPTALGRSGGPGKKRRVRRTPNVNGAYFRVRTRARSTQRRAFAGQKRPKNLPEIAPLPNALDQWGAIGAR